MKVWVEVVGRGLIRQGGVAAIKINLVETRGGIHITSKDTIYF